MADQLDEVLKFIDENTTNLIFKTMNDTSDGLVTNQSFGNESIEVMPYENRIETYIVPIVFALIFIIGVFGNGILVIIFMRQRTMRNVPNTYIFSLALADLLVIITTVPPTASVYVYDSWPWSQFLCTSTEFFKDVSIGVSVFTLTALSSDRFFAIVDPLRKFHAHGGGKRATRTTIATAIGIWILAILCGIPAIVGTRVELVTEALKPFNVCTPFRRDWGKEYSKAIVLSRFIIYYTVPLIIIGIFYILIARHLVFTANVPGEMQGAVRQIRARRKVAITVLAFVVIFGVCFLPSHIFMLWFYYHPDSNELYGPFWHVFRITGFCLSFANSCANPVALYCVSGAFRKHFNRYLFRRNPRSSRLNQCDVREAQNASMMSTIISRRYPSRRISNQCNFRTRIQETSVTCLPDQNNGYITVEPHTEHELINLNGRNPL